MRPVFDLLDEIIERVKEYLYETGCQPSVVFVSRGSYRRLLELHSQDPLALTAIAGLTVVIDEMFAEPEVMVGG